MKIGVYGGSFNPVHLGHLKLMEASVKELQLDKLMVVPCYIQPFKMDTFVDNSTNRLEMLNMAIKNPKVEVSRFEIDEGDVSYTEETLNYFRSIYKGSEIIFILGTDSFLTLDSWKNGEYLLSNFSYAVASRPGYDEDILKNKVDEYINRFNTTVYLIEEKMPYISSTKIRENFKNGLSNKEFLMPEINDYILKNGLYKA